jgi:hypothetical protein
MPQLPRIHVPLLKPEDVIPHLGKGELHWRDGFSAKSVCTSWFNANDIPPGLRNVLDQAVEFRGAELLDAWLERCRHLPWGKGNPSQTDLLAVLRTGDGLAVLGVEAKVKESFGPIVRDWLADGGANKAERLRGLCNLLGIEEDAAMILRYQLFHRTAAAILEAKRYGARHAAMIVQSFCPDRTGLGDFQAFAEVVGFGSVAADGISEAKELDGVSVRIGWAADRIE